MDYKIWRSVNRSASRQLEFMEIRAVCWHVAFAHCLTFDIGTLAYEAMNRGQNRSIKR